MKTPYFTHNCNLFSYSIFTSDCGSLEEIDNGDVTYSSTIFEAEAVYTCEEGYYLSSVESVRTCEHGGTWSGEEPICIIYGMSHEFVATGVNNFFLRLECGIQVSKPTEFIKLQKQGTKINCFKKSDLKFEKHFLLSFF